MAAPEAFAALAEELRAQSDSSRPDNGDPSRCPGSRKSEHRESETNEWFSKLPAEIQSEVVKYAAVHIAKNSKLFELTDNGGKYNEYFNLTLSIARSGVANAEDIFVEVASIAKDADSEEKLREFFRSCENAAPRTDGITVGTLLHAASQHGAEFGQW